MKTIIDRIKTLAKTYPALRLLAATLFATLGVMLAHPEKGLVATLPLALVFFLLAALCAKAWYTTPCLAAAVALLYAKMADFADGTALVLFCALTGLLAVCAVLPLRLPQKKGSRLLFLVLLPALVLPLLFWGAPWSYASQRSAALSYVATTYPDQSFSETRFHYSPSERAWCLTVSYAQNEGELSSVLLFADGACRDGFRDAFAARAMEQRKADLMDVLAKEAETDALVEPLQLNTAAGEILRGSYGEAEAELYGKMCFTVTFRKEYLSRKELAQAASLAKAALEAEGMAYASLRFQAQDAGTPIYAVDVTPAMTDEEILLAAVKL